MMGDGRFLPKPIAANNITLNRVTHNPYTP